MTCTAPAAAAGLVLLGTALLAAPPAALAQPGDLQTAAGPVVVEELAAGLVHPWGMAFLPDGRMLVTERPGRLRLLDPESGVLSPPLSGTPEVVARGQGGLLDVVVDPGFAENRRVWLSFAEPGDGGASTALGHGRLDGEAIRDFTTVFSQRPKFGDQKHFGGRIVFDRDGNLFLTLGDRGQFDPAQDLSNHVGTVVRLAADGGAAPGNPFLGREDALPEIWSYGHRNIESADLHPVTGELWVAEMGPRDGDELNRPEAGRNHGWPLVSWGRHYSGAPIPDPPTRPEFADAAMHWTPVISPSGMQFYTGDAFPGWQGSALIGGLSAQAIVRVATEGGAAREVERIPMGARIRNVKQGPDGLVYVLTDRQNGAVWRLRPQQG